MVVYYTTNEIYGSVNYDAAEMAFQILISMVYQNHTPSRSDRMAYVKLPNGSFVYVSGNYQYSNEHGLYYNNQREETELVNSIVDQKLNEYSRQAEVQLEQAIKNAVEEYGSLVWERLLQEVMRVLESDIVSEVHIGFEGCKDIFYGKQAQTYISDKIIKATKAELGKIKGISVL